MSEQHNNSLPLLPYLCQPSAILGLVLVGELLTLVLVLANADFFSWHILGALSMVVQWIILLSALFLCKLRDWLSRPPPLISGAIAYIICLLVSASVLSGSQLISHEPFDPWLFAKSLTIAAIFSGIILRYLYIQQQLINQKQSELKARIQSLQARIRPHFLFNSMNTIASLITIDPKAAEKTLEDLSELFRSSLQAPGLVSLEQELELCRHYIDIEERRLAERLTVHWDMPDNLPDMQIPSLLLQPLLENAIYHGIQRLPEGGELRVTVSPEKHHTAIFIDNPVATLAASHTDSGNRMALDNIRNRLQLYFNDKAKLEKTESDGRYRVTLIIPDHIKD